MRAPWGAPTVSDAAKLELIAAHPFEPYSRMARLVPQSVEAQDFAGNALPAGWTEVDTDTYVAFRNGRMELAGNGTANANGVYTGARTTAPAKVTHTLFFPNNDVTVPNGKHIFGFADAPLETPGEFPYFYPSGANISIFSGFTPAGMVLAYNVTYTLRYYYQYATGDDTAGFRVTIQGGIYTAETTIAAGSMKTAMAAAIKFEWSMYKITMACYVDDFAWLMGYPTDGPTHTVVADAGAGKVFTGVTFTNLAAVGGWATTNCTFAYSYDDGTPSYSAEKTLAQLQALDALTTHKRYLRVRVTVNSDGATQQYAGEINADDVLTGAETPGAVFPAAGNTLSGSGAFGPTGADYTPTLTLPAAGEVSNLADDFGNPDDPVEPTREDAEEGNVLAGSGNYGDPGAPLVPAYAPDFPDAANVLTNDTTDGEPGAAKIRVSADIKIKAV